MVLEVRSGTFAGGGNGDSEPTCERLLKCGRLDARQR